MFFNQYWKLLAVIAAMLVSAAAQAQATRTWVSGVGDDANPCSRTAPCKTFAGAISKTATGGEINVLDPGGFGAVTITKAITIDGSGGSTAGVLVSGTNGITINAATTSTVTLRNLDINGLGSGLVGISVIQAGRVLIENTKVYSFLNQGISLKPTSPGLTMAATIRDSNISYNGKAGILVEGTGGAAVEALIDSVLLTSNSRGVHVSDGNSAVVRNTIANSNTAIAGSSHGFVLGGIASAASLTLENCSASGHTNTGVFANGAFAQMTVSNTVIARNQLGIDPAGGSSIRSFGNNKVFGNISNGAFTAPTIAQM